LLFATLLAATSTRGEWFVAIMEGPVYPLLGTKAQLMGEVKLQATSGPRRTGQGVEREGHFGSFNIGERGCGHENAKTQRTDRQKPEAHSVPYLLPALYGGELNGNGEQYEALFVLQDPSLGETERNWRRCETPEEAVQLHRSIFTGWAFKLSTNQCRLFQTFSGAFGKTENPFFKRFYVTDIWKAGLGTNDKRFWRGKLRIELREVRAKRIIFIGSQALTARVLLRKGTKYHHIRFPYAGLSDYATNVAQLLQEIEKDESLPT
jgi:hypothetical protein